MSMIVEYKKGDKVQFPFPTNNKNGASVAPTANGTIVVYEGTNTTELTAGVAGTYSLDTRPGVNLIEVDTSEAAYQVGFTYHVVNHSMTIDGETVNAMVGSFFLRSQSIDDVWGSGIIRAEWDWSTDTTATDPGSGNIKANNTNYSLVTQIYISQSSRRGFNANAVLDTLKVNDYIAIAMVNDPDRFLAGQVSGTPVDNGSWWTIPVTINDSSISQINNGARTDVGFLIVNADVNVTKWQGFAIPGAGMIEDDGSGDGRFSTKALEQAPTGSGGGIIFRDIWQWSTSTAATDPTSGRIKANSGTFASITEIYISDTTKDGANRTGAIEAISSGDKIQLSRSGSQTNYILATATAAPVDNGSWYTIAVTVEESGGSFNNNQDTITEFIYLASGQPSGPVDLNPDQSGVTIGTVINLTNNNDKTGYSLAAGQKVDVDTIKTRSDSAQGLANSTRALVSGAVVGTPTVSSVEFSAAFVGSLNGRTIYFYTGNILNEAASIGTSTGTTTTTVTFVDADGNPADLSAAPGTGDLVVVA